MSRGFSGSGPEHGRHYNEFLDRTNRFLDSAERVLRGGDCRAGIEAATSAFESYGEAHAHRVWLKPRNRRFSDDEWIRTGTRLNFLRQALKRCVG
jgi:hypothetical protein